MSAHSSSPDSSVSSLGSSTEQTQFFVVWHPTNSTIRVSISLRIRIIPASHSESLAVPNHIMFSLTCGLSLYSNHYPCYLILPGITFSFFTQVSPSDFSRLQPGTASLGPLLYFCDHHQFLPACQHILSYTSRGGVYLLPIYDFYEAEMMF